jgi:dihydroorotate dehydrogenase
LHFNYSIFIEVCSVQLIDEGMARRLIHILSLSTAAAAGYCATCDIYAGPVGALIRKLDGEAAHRLGLTIARSGLIRPDGLFPPPERPVLRVSLWGVELPSPIGLAAGFDKDAVAVKGLLSMGFAAVEIGSVTPQPQPGNSKPRVFRLEEDRGVINRYGFNSAGLDVVKRNLVRYDYGGKHASWIGIVGVNLGKNKATSEEDAVNDYVAGMRQLGDLADYVVINVSSPNTPGLRALQGLEHLRAVLVPVLAARNALVYKPPVLVKIAPDLTESEKADIAKLALELHLDGIVVSNTTIARPACLMSEHRGEAGGLSGRPLKDMSTAVLGDMYRLTGGKIPLIGVGGVENGQDAYDKIRAGASFVQLYTALVFDGPWLVPRVKRELADLLERDGFSCVADAVGVDQKLSA